MGYSWNWGIKNASYDFVLQSEDDWDFIFGQENLKDKDRFIENLKVQIEIIKE